jgi:acyl-coenzyme A thioesterase PaaI-like protein
VAEHTELCFGCGPANPFGLQLEWERIEGGVSGRFFVKQDHQGPGGVAHPGVLTAALEEAMGLAASSWPSRVEVWLASPAPVGSFVTVTAWLEDPGVCAAASGERGEMVAEATGTLD